MWAWMFRAVLIMVALAQTAVIVLLAVLALPQGPPTTAPLDPGSQFSDNRSVGSFPRSFGQGESGPCMRILAIDGGGVRGIVPALLLAEIERRTGAPIARQFNVIAGTSTGAILSLGLTRPSDADAQMPAYAAADIVALYRDHASEIFPTSLQWLRDLQRIFRPKYFAQGRDDLYDAYFTDVRMMEALTQVLVPAYDIEDRRRVWFDSFDESALVLNMKDVVAGATAAPTYLPPVKFAVDEKIAAKGYLALVDGALFADNPALQALETARRRLPADSDQSILLLSVGTGSTNVHRSFESAWNWGILGWVDPLLEITISDPAVERTVATAMRDHDYMRLEPELGPEPVALDDASPATLDRLTAVTQDYIKAHDADLQVLAKTLAKPRAKTCSYSGSDWDRPQGPRKHAASAS